jgi:hypothetical protein
LLPLTAAAGPPIEGELLAPASAEEMASTGCPQTYRWWAQPQKFWNYGGYYVGGGNPFRRACNRCVTDGTWGWDYVGPIMPRVVDLGWWWHPKSQGGSGRYEPDGPRLLHELGVKE